MNVETMTHDHSYLSEYELVLRDRVIRPGNRSGRKCLNLWCPTRLASDNPGDYCSAHTEFDELEYEY